MNKRRGEQQSISDKIAELLAPKPLLDPEIDATDETAARTESYELDDTDIQIDQKLSEIRKKNIPLLQDVDEKYRGAPATRNDFDELDGEVEIHSNGSESGHEDKAPNNGFSMRLKTFEESDDDDDGPMLDTAIGSDEDASTDNEDNASENGNISDNSVKSDDIAGESNESDDSNDDEESDFDGGDIIPKENSTEDNDQRIIKRSDQTTDIKKGISVQNQLKVWEKLLEMRIHSQKMLIKANSLPNCTAFNTIKNQNSDFDSLSKETAKSAANLLHKLLDLQEALTTQYPDTKDLVAKRKRQSNDSENGASKVPKYEERLHSSFEDYRNYRSDVISKWHDRTKVLTPGSKATKTDRYDIVQSIQDILLNKNELIKKSQLHKGTYELFHQKPSKDSTQNNSNELSEIYCSEIYDDTDFYHTQLRELIEFKTNTTNNLTDMSKQFAELQKLRNKIKKPVDTRASKGRKIRYAVHKKLVNFMAQNDESTWTDEAKNELYSSLFGSTT